MARGLLGVSLVLLGVARWMLWCCYGVVRCIYGVTRWLLWCCLLVAMVLLGGF